jgi:hypothetical protein
MFKKTIRFTDFNGDEVEEDFYFHLSKAELLQMAADGNAMKNRLARIIARGDGKAILGEFRDLIQMSVGVRSEDGKRFIKDRDAKSRLLDSPAFDELLMELATDADASVVFVQELIPEKMQKEMTKHLEAQKVGEAPSPFGEDPLKVEENDERPAWLRENRNPTPQELQNMSKQELQLAFQHRK